MSAPYLAAVRTLDDALGRLGALLGIPTDPHTLLIALADHGGGGTDPRDHDSAHPNDRTIPILIAGAGLEADALADGTHLLDIPATVLDALGIPVPPCYGGRSVFGAAEILAA